MVSMPLADISLPDWTAHFADTAFFLPSPGSLLLNEIAPRPHNSGHHTIEACHTSQFENHLRAILSLPLGDTSLRVPSAAMVNVLGVDDSMGPVEDIADASLAVPGATVHLYGKAASRRARKMGHITVCGPSDAEVRGAVRTLLEAQPDLDATFIDSVAAAPVAGHSHAQPLVGIIMGSDSDLPTMLPATKILDKFGVAYELTITSAHRTPDRMVQYARAAASRGLRAIIAGAGGAAHLPGMVASETSVPVIGVPVKASVLDGVDSLYSIIQMPRGIPVATVGINNSTNAALLAIRILGTSVSDLQVDTEKYSKALEEEVLDKAEVLEEMGWDKYVTDVLKK
jgi:phosphoribosylaminoimidazole carboxylase